MREGRCVGRGIGEGLEMTMMIWRRGDNDDEMTMKRQHFGY